MKNLLIIFFIFLFNDFGCQDCTEIIKTKNIRLIKIKLPNNNVTYCKKSANQDKIKKFLFELNKAKRDPSIFKSQFTLMIIYNNGIELPIICNENRFKVNGLTYKLDNSIDGIVRLYW